MARRVGEEEVREAPITLRSGSADVELNDDKLKGTKKKPPMSWSDVSAILVLLGLYFLQGVPLGITSAMPMVFQDKNLSDADQGTFSFASWPFSLKILWAPIVDAVFSSKLGRRKSWVIPTQATIGLVLYFTSFYVDAMLDTSGDGVDIYALTGIFFGLFLLCATQDIAVDGWALTMLSHENVGYASICNSVGQTLGASVAFLLHSYSLVTLAEAMRFWAYLFVIITAAVLIFKKEKVPADNAIEDIREAYSGTFSVLKLKQVRSLLMVLLVVKAPFVVAEGLTTLRLQALGMPKSAIANLGLLTTPVSLLLPGLINPGRNVLNLFKRSFLPRLLLLMVFPLLVLYAPDSFVEPFPYVYYGLVAVASILTTVVATSMFVAQMAFFAQISDDALGGTYMTLLNTFANLGYKLPASVVFFLVDKLSSYSCVANDNQEDGFNDTAQTCHAAGGVWEKVTDGYFPCCAGSLVVGLALYFGFIRQALDRLQNTPKEAWQIA